MKKFVFLILAISISEALPAAASDSKCMSSSQARMITNDVREMTERITQLIGAFQDPNTCMANAVKTDSDGSVNLNQTPMLAKKFRENCLTRNVSMAKCDGGMDSPDYYDVLVKKNGGKTEFNNEERKIVCSEHYIEGPIVISAVRAKSMPICFGVAHCSMPDGSKKNLNIACNAGLVEDIAYCSSPTTCLQSGDANVWAKNIRTSKTQR